jgi:hypothetical protein
MCEGPVPAMRRVRVFLARADENNETLSARGRREIRRNAVVGYVGADAERFGYIGARSLTW